MRLLLGTGGFAYADWVGLLYPEGSKPPDWLRLYAKRLNALELNASFYALPGEKTFAGLLRKSEGRLRFAVKLHRSMTHDRNAPAELYERLKSAVHPLREAGRLGPFWPSFPKASTAPRKTAAISWSWPSGLRGSGLRWSSAT